MRIAIIGRGLIGSAAARHLAEAGHEVVLIGPGEPANYASHPGVFGSHYDEGRITRTSRISFPLGFMGGVIGKLSAQENCRFIAGLYGIDPDYLEAFCRWLANIDEYFEMPVATYSAGMRARLSFALLLALDFDFYLIDEGMPAATDAEFNRKAGTILRERLEKATVVIVSHQAETLEKFCRSAAVLLNGQLYMFDTLEEAKQLYDYETQS